MRSSGNLPARPAQSARIVAAGQAQQGLGKRTGCEEASHTGGTHEEVGVGDSAAPDCALEDPAGVGLPDEVSEWHVGLKS